MGRINHTPNFFHFKNQQSSLDIHQSDGKNAGSVPAYAPNPNSQTACHARWYVPRSMGSRWFELVGSLGYSCDVTTLDRRPLHEPYASSQTAMRAVGPLIPPAPFSPGQSPGGEGEPSGYGVALH